MSDAHCWKSGQIFRSDPQRVPDDGHRDREGQIGDDVEGAVTGVHRAIEACRRDRLDPRTHCLDATRRERLGHDGTQAPMFGSVDTAQKPLEDRRHRAERLGNVTFDPGAGRVARVG
jgi:hypothetical protein